MIVEGGKHGCARNLASYLMRKSSSPELIELRGSATTDVAAALTDWETTARILSKGTRVLYHCYIRIRDNERLNQEQWITTIDRLENALGLSGRNRAIVAHSDRKHGAHLHIVWSRLRDDETLVPLSNDRRQFHAAARWAEKEFKLTPVESKKNKSKRISNRDIKAIKSRGTTADQLQKLLTKIWNTTSDGIGFRAALDAHDLMLLKGDRRDYVIDLDGFKFNPVRLLPGVTAAEFRQRMADVPVLSETPPAEMLRGRKARSLARSQIDGHLANDEGRAKAKRGFRKFPRGLRQMQPQNSPVPLA